MIVSEEVVDQTWKGVADYSPDEMIKEMQKFGEKQPPLLSFAVANSEEMRREVGELVLYLAFVVYKMFEKSYKIPVVSAEIIEEVDEKNYNSMETLAGENFMDELAKTPSMLRQRHVFHFLGSALFEEDSDLVLTPEEQGLVFIILKTVIDSLDKATQEGPPGSKSKLDLSPALKLLPKTGSIESKIRDGGKCLCDVCGKTSKMGGFLDPQAANPLVACYDCMLKITAKQQGISVAEAKKRREKMLKTSNLFSQIKIDDFFEFAGERASGGMDELNEVLRYVMNVQNTFGKKAIEEFEKMDEDELRKAYGKVKMNFSFLIKTPKYGRNDLCPCGSGKKYKKCCLIHDELEDALVAEWKKCDSSVIKKGMLLIDNSDVLDAKLLIEYYWGEKRLDMVRGKGVDGTDEFEYNEWLMDDYYLKNEDIPHVLGKLLADESLTSQERTIVEARIKSPMSIWLITYVKKGRGALIRNIFNQEERFVHDIRFSESAKDGYLIPARVLNVGAYNLISGAYRAYPGPFSQDIREIIRKEYDHYKSHEDINAFLRRHGYLFGRLSIKLKDKLANGNK